MSKKADVFWVSQKRSMPTAFKLFTGDFIFIIFPLWVINILGICLNIDRILDYSIVKVFDLFWVFLKGRILSSNVC